MAKLVFDIETSALPLAQFDAAQQEYLFRDALNLADPEARQKRQEEILRQFNLWPFTAQVVCIAMLNAETSRGKVLFVAEDFEEAGAEAGAVEFTRLRRRGPVAGGILGAGQTLRFDCHLQRTRI